MTHWECYDYIVMGDKRVLYVYLYSNHTENKLQALTFTAITLVYFVFSAGIWRKIFTSDWPIK